MKQELVVFHGYSINKFMMEKKENISNEQKGTLDLKCNTYENTDKKHKDKYRVEMNLKVYSEQTEIYISIDGYFTISNKLEDDAKEYFLKISAPAIIYPYVRTFVSNATSLDTGDAVILPVIDFASS